MEYKEMLEIINRAKQSYYGDGRSELSDKEYDRLVAQAEKLGYIETVGSAPVDAIEKITHQHPMLSLDKCHSADEVTDFAGSHEIVAMWKADGLTVSAAYEDGVLSRLETRGNGEIGNDIMFHANSITNLPKHIDRTGRFVIDGECVILWSDFADINSKIVKEERYSHARNLAAGSLNQLDPAVSARRRLRFYAWDVIEGGSNSLVYNLADASALGFDTVKYCTVASNTPNAVDEAIKHLQQAAEDESFPIDGIVFKFDNISYGKTLGNTAHHFRNAIAYKFQDETHPTKLRWVEWKCGKTGVLTPVAIFDPVDFDGTIVEKSTLHNVSYIRQLGLTNRCTVYIKRANDIIPNVEYADVDGDGEVEIPTTCPICGAPTIIKSFNGPESLYCTNDYCAGKMLGLWETFVSKKGMDIAGLSGATLETLLNRGFLTNMFESIYDLKSHKKELYKLNGYGKKSIDALIKAIEASKDVDLQHFITAFSIPGIGVNQSKALAKEFETFENFAEACDNEFMFRTIDSIGPAAERNIINWWMVNHMQMMDVAALCRFKTAEFMNPPTGNFPLVGLTFSVTGKLHIFNNREDLHYRIQQLGGKVSANVSKKVNYLINNDKDSNSHKNMRAKELGVKIISEDDFMMFIQ